MKAICIGPSRTLAERIRNLGLDVSQFAEELDQVESVAVVWPDSELPPGQLHVIVSLVPRSKKRVITPTSSAIGIEVIDEKINKKLDSLRGMIEAFQKNPEPPTWNPPHSIAPSDRDFLTNLRIPCYRDGHPSLLFHNLDECDDQEIEMIFGPRAHKYVVINRALNTSQHVQAGAFKFATHLARVKPVAC